jgi:RNA polymerase sigma-70 factor (ECF subfamily)
MYRRYAEPVLGWAIRLGGPYVDHEDIAQDVFTVAFRQIDRFRGESALSTWLYAITRNLISNARRKAAFRKLIGLANLPEVASDADSPEEEVALYRRRQQVQLALDRLSERSREVVVLMDLEGRTATEVGEMLGVPPGTVYSRLHYARKEFAKALERQGLGRAQVVGEVAHATSGGR